MSPFARCRLAFHFSLSAGTLTAITLTPSTGFAASEESSTEQKADDELHSGQEEEPLIYGGQRASTCDFPTTVLMQSWGSMCTGTLVHPQVVLYAAHCPIVTQVRFGETGNSGSAGVERCEKFTNADAVGPDDYAYCKLSSPVNNVPITPVLMGCEVDKYMVWGGPATIAGFGQTDSGGSGTKYWADTEITGVGEGVVVVGKNGIGAWQGDSGGPAYVQLEDGSWRAFGITSGGSGGGMPVTYVRMDKVVEWVEERSGVDITPCHDADGTWNPSASCGGYATNLRPGGSWNNGCSSNDPLSGASETCGPPHGTDDDGTAPIVSITSPSDGDNFEENPSEIDVEFSIDDPWPASVTLMIDGNEVATDSTEPFKLNKLSFPKGSFELKAIAKDYWGNTGESESITISVGGAAPSDPSDSSDPTDSDDAGDEENPPEDSANPDDDGESNSDPDPTTDGNGASGSDTDDPSSGAEDPEAGDEEGGTSGPDEGDEPASGSGGKRGCHISADSRNNSALPLAATFMFLGFGALRRRLF